MSAVHGAYTHTPITGLMAACRSVNKLRTGLVHTLCMNLLVPFVLLRIPIVVSLIISSVGTAMVNLFLLLRCTT